MNVVLVTLVDLSGTSGQNLYSRQIANALMNTEGVNLEIVCPHPKREEPALFSSNNVTAHYFTEKQRRDPKWNLRIQPEIITHLRKIHKTNPLDGIVTPLKPGLVAPPLFSFCYRVPQILLVEGMLEKNVAKMSPFPGATIVAKGIAKLNAMNSIHAFAAYDEAKDWIQLRRGLADTPVETFHHGVDIENFQPVPMGNARDKINLVSNDDFVVTFVGSFKEYHCLEPLLRAVHNSEKEIKLLLVGEGPKQNNIKSFANTLDVDAHFTGFVDHEEVNTYISAANVTYGAIDPAHWGSPMKVFEYLSCGRPVLATYSDSLSFVETEELGILVETPSESAIKSSLESLYDMSEQDRSDMGKRGHEYILENRTWDKLAMKMVRSISEKGR